MCVGKKNPFARLDLAVRFCALRAWQRGALLGAVSLCLLLPGARLAFWDRDEAVYAEVAREMVRSADYVTPRLFGEPFAEKPPLAMWCTALAFRLFGESEIAGRLPHLLFAAGSIVLMVPLGDRLLGRRSGHLAAFVLANSLFFLVSCRLLLTDSSLLFFAVATIAALVRALDGGASGWSAVAGAALGLAVLAKGPVALLAPVLFCAGHFAARPQGFRFRSALSLVARVLAVAAAVSLPWFVLVAHRSSGELARSFLLEENLARFLHPMEGHRGPAFYYLVVLAVGLFPWTGLLVSGLVCAWKGGRRAEAWAVAAWAFGTLAIFSLSATKLPHYLLPALPAFALLAVAAEGAVVDRIGAFRLFVWTQAATGVALLLAAGFAVRLWGISGAVVIPFAIVAGLGLALPLLTSRRLALGIAALLPVLLATCVPPLLDPARCLPELGRRAGALRRGQETFGELGIHEPALGYYADVEHFERWKKAADVERAVASSPTRSILVCLAEDDARRLAGDERLQIELLARRRSLIDSARGWLLLYRVAARRE